MGNLAAGRERPAFDPGTGRRELPRVWLVAGWAIRVRRIPQAREDRERLSGEYRDGKNGVVENLWGRLSSGSRERSRVLSVGRRGRVCLHLRADAVAGVCD